MQESWPIENVLGEILLTIKNQLYKKWQVDESNDVATKGASINYDPLERKGGSALQGGGGSFPPLRNPPLCRNTLNPKFIFLISLTKFITLSVKILHYVAKYLSVSYNFWDFEEEVLQALRN